MDINEANTALQQQKDHLLQTYVRPDFVLVRGEGMTVYDSTGKAYQDWVAGIAVNALGYGDAGVRDTLLNQIETGLIHTSNLYHTVPAAQLAQKLTEKSFADRVFFSNSGTEANEGALKFARRVAYDTGNVNKRGIVAFSHAFHGRTLGSLSITPKDKYQAPFKPLLADVAIGEYNDIASAKALINDDTCAVFLEPIQGEGGIHEASPEFLRAVRDLCDKHHAILIFDEVQCGVGRTGDLWAHEASGVTPDIMTLAKPLAAGFPIGAILVKQFIADHIKPGDHGSTFAGGPATTAVAGYVLDRISDPEFLAHVEDTGDYLKERLLEINSPLIKEVRGRGLMIGVEMSIDVTPVINAGYEQGLLLVNAGADVIRLVPPLIATRDDVDNLIDRLTTILEALPHA
jgi:acetylornithine/N-succinyldiaminopimelate aminotransferase